MRDMTWFALIVCWICVIEGAVLNGGSENVVVAIGYDVEQPKDCDDFLRSIEASFSDASVALHQSTDGRVFFHDVTVVLPSSWRCSKQVARSSEHGLQDAKFRLTKTDELVTQQPRSCGKRGEFVNIPASFFGRTDQPLNQGQLIFDKWIQLRYGVFDTSRQGVISSCVPSLMPSRKVCEGNCTKASFPKCDLSDLVKTRHGILCNGVPPKDIVMSHPEVANRASVPMSDVKFRYVTEGRARFVLALDTGSAMLDRDVWKFIRIASRRFILRDLPNGTEIGIVSFADKARSETNATVALTSGKIRESVVAKIPEYPDNKSEKCLECAVREAVRLFEKDGGSASGNVVVLITSGTSNINDINSAVNLAKQKKLKISVIAYTASFDHQEFIASETGGFLSIVESKGVGPMSHLSMMIELGDSLLATLAFHLRGTSEESNVPVLVHEAEYRDSTQSFANGTFYLDPAVGRDTLFALYFYSRDNPHVKQLWLTSPDKMKHEGKSEDSLAALYFTPLVNVEANGVWEYSFKREAQSHQSHFVKVTSRPKQAGQSTVNARLLKITDSGKINASESPIILYAEVTSGGIPVQNARVRVSVRYNETETTDVYLFDSGNGDPDIKHGDGIYSRYFMPPVTGTMHYVLTLHVDDNDGRAFTSKATEGLKPADGSGLTTANEMREYISAFRRIVPVPLLTVTQAPPIEMNPPNRITNLEASAEGDVIELKWTAPGNDFDFGVAESYELKYSNSLMEILSPAHFSNLPAVEIQQSPLLVGAPNTFTFRFTNYDIPYYFAIRAVDTNGNKGAISNVVSALIDSPPTTPSPVTTVTPQTSKSVARDSAHLSIAAIAGITAGGLFALILIITAACCAVHKSKKQRKEEKMRQSTLNGLSIYSSEELKKAAVKEPEKVLQPEYQTQSETNQVLGTQPVHWSASQLLQEHEKRQTSYAPSADVSYHSNLNYSYPSYNHVNAYNQYYSGASSLPYTAQEERYGPYGGGASPPSDSYNSATSEGPIMPPPYDSSGEYPAPSKVPPATLPKPIVNEYEKSFQGSFASLTNDKKIRNITQV